MRRIMWWIESGNDSDSALGRIAWWGLFLLVVYFVGFPVAAALILGAGFAAYLVMTSIAGLLGWSVVIFLIVALAALMR